MIVGLGVDIVSLGRIQKSVSRFGMRFAEKILCEEEMAVIPTGWRQVSFLAGRWAAKEAFVKALGTGFDGGIGPADICILNDSTGRPLLKALGSARRKMEEFGVLAAHLSISHERENAVAVVVLEKE